jgi:hypothetical protein
MSDSTNVLSPGRTQVCVCVWGGGDLWAAVTRTLVLVAAVAAWWTAACPLECANPVAAAVAAAAAVTLTPPPALVSARRARPWSRTASHKRCSTTQAKGASWSRRCACARGVWGVQHRVTLCQQHWRWSRCAHVPPPPVTTRSAASPLCTPPTHTHTPTHTQTHTHTVCVQPAPPGERQGGC